MANPPHVALFITCLNDTFYPRVGEAVVRVLRHLGCRVSFPTEQTCCGQPAYNSGAREEAALVADRMLDVFAPYEWVVSPSASCVSMVREHFPALLADDPPRAALARDLASRTFEFSCFLERVLNVDIPALLKLDEPTTYHYPCHARGQFSPNDLNRTLGGDAQPNLRTPEHPDLCCGFGGVFSVDYAEVSGAMLADKLAEFTNTGAKQVICSEAGCGLNIAGGAKRHGADLRFKHLAEVLAESLNLLEPEA